MGVDCKRFVSRFCASRFCRLHGSVARECCRCHGLCCTGGAGNADHRSAGRTGRAACTDGAGRARGPLERWPDDPKHPCRWYSCVDGRPLLQLDIRAGCPLERWPDDPKHPCRWYSCVDGRPLLQLDIRAGCRDPPEGYTCVSSPLERWPDDPKHPCRWYSCVDGRPLLQLDIRAGCRDPPEGYTCVSSPLERWPDDPKHPCRWYSCVDGRPLLQLDIRAGCRDPPEGYTCVSNDPKHPCRWYSCVDGRPLLQLDIRAGCRDPPEGYTCVSSRRINHCCTDYNCTRTVHSGRDRVFIGGGVHISGGVIISGIGASNGPLERWPDDPKHPCRWYSCVDGRPMLQLDIRAGCRDPPEGYTCVSSRRINHCCIDYNCTRTVHSGSDRVFIVGGVHISGGVITSGSGGSNGAGSSNGGTGSGGESGDSGGGGGSHSGGGPFVGGGSNWISTGSGFEFHTSDGIGGGVITSGSGGSNSGGAGSSNGGAGSGGGAGSSGGGGGSHNGGGGPGSGSGHSGDGDGVGTGDAPDNGRDAAVGICVDGTGVVRYYGSTWTSADGCTHYVCDNGHISMALVDCAPLPGHPCVPVPVPGRCCPRYDCSNDPPPNQDCVDGTGQVRAHGSTWTSAGGCTQHACYNGHVATATVDCAPSPGSYCVPVPVPGQCCPIYICDSTNCVDGTGQVRPHGSTWTSADGCTHYTCDNGHISTTTVDCAPPPGPNCVPVPVSGQCCPSYNCSDSSLAPCTHAGRTYPDGVQFPDDEDHPCSVLECDDGTVRVVLPPPQCATLTCVDPQQAPGQCCPVCPADCVDNTGQVRPHGSTWTSAHGCTHYACYNGHISNATVDCLPSPGPNCVPVSVSGECCPHYNCDNSQCVDGTGQIRPHGSTWTNADGCTHYACDNGNISTAIVDCAPPPGSSNCVPVPVPGRCCPRYNCDNSHCVDGPGQVRPHGSIWTSADGCTHYACDNGHISTTAVNCAPPPRPNCVPVPVSGQCCPSYNCSDSSLAPCTHAGRTYPDGAQFPDDEDHPCSVLECDDGTVRVVLPPPQCATLTCVDPQQAPGQCCPVCPAEGCVDSAGVTHAVNSVYLDGLDTPGDCYVCAAGSPPQPLLAQNVARSCPRAPPGCNETFEEGRCCPTISCPDGDPCIFEGVAHAPGTQWMDDLARPCVTYTCVLGVAVQVGRVECAPLPDGCSALYTDGFCCPEHDCPGAPCTHAGQQHDDGTSWPQDPVRPCTILSCHDGHVLSEDVSDQCAPPPTGPGTCTPAHVDYQCCPVYDCVRATCEYNGTTYSEGDTWPDNETFPCKRFNCTLNGPVKVADYGAHCPPQPNPHCTGLRTPGYCCKQWNCPDEPKKVPEELHIDCKDSTGQVRPHGSTWTSADGCTNYACYNGNISTATVDCAPPPGPNCAPVPVPEQCCPSYNCDNSHCVDGTGQVRPHGSTWTSVDGCTHYTCDNGHIYTATVDCAGPPGPYCVSVSVPGQCCPHYNCSNSHCVDGTGQVRPHGSTWTSVDGCTHYTCDNGHISTAIVDCAPPPRPNCVPVPVSGQCCPSYNCSDSSLAPCTHAGRMYPDGAQFPDDEDHPCSVLECDDGTVRVVLPPPQCATLTCVDPQQAPGQCCPVCPADCEDNTGQVRPHGSTWTSADGCTHYACDNGHIATAIVHCPPPPGPNCVPISVSGECCPRYNCDNSQCVDNTGQVRPHGSTWTSADGCTHYACDNGNISTVIVDCAPPPGPNCLPVPVPGQCCPRYNCDNSHCVDGTGQVRPHGSTWTSADGCTHYACDNGHISAATVDCAPPPGPNCVPVPVSGQCCPSYNCDNSHCVDGTGQVRPHGSTWTSADGCRHHACHNGHISTTAVDCAPPPRPNCVPVPVSGQCCPSYNCSDSSLAPCTHAGRTYPDGAQFPDDEDHPCSVLECDDGTVRVVLPPPQCATLTCVDPQQAPGQCCPVCPADCVDNAGQVRPHGSTWTSADGCTQYACYNGHVSNATVDCLPSPGPNCVPVSVPGDCCPHYNCDNSHCVDNTGQVRPHGSTWTSAHGCKHYTCDNGHISTTTVDCTPSPGPNCVSVPVPGQCCPRYNCDNSHCVDGTGQVRPHGSTWTSADGCTHYACDNGRISTATVDCAPPPGPNCVPVPVPGQCCPSYYCDNSHCVDGTGQVRPHGSTWTSADGCTHYTCDNGHISTTTVDCAPPPRPNCVPVPVSGQCCPSYNCSDSSLAPCTHAGRTYPDGAQFPDDEDHPCSVLECDDGTVRVVLPPPQCAPLTCVDPQQAPGQCCPVCPADCEDNTGQIRPHGSNWTSGDGCTRYACYNGHISTAIVDCLPSPGPNCVPVSVPGDCCPYYSCDNSHCVDGTGEDRPHGSTWTSADGCTHYTCNNGHISTAIVDCAPSPGPNCVSVLTPGQCCPSYNCDNSHCVDGTGQVRPHGSTWTSADGCTHYACDNGHISTATVDCAPPPGPNCVPVPVPGQCCLRYNCDNSNCVDGTGQVRPHGSTWTSADGCTHYTCDNSNISTATVDCAPPPRPNCVPVPEPGQCCPSYNCSDSSLAPCTHAGRTYPDGAQFPDDEERPCSVLECDDGTVRVVLPPPRCATLTCVDPRQEPGQCCPVCPADCEDNTSHVRPHGSTWTSANGCTHYACYNGHISNATVDCLPSPGPNCVPVSVPGECCPHYNCDSSPCEDSTGQVRPHGSTWTSADGCTHFACDNGHVSTAIVDCAPPPRPNCVPITVPAHCCPRYNCDNSPCVDGTGQVRPHGSTWTSADSCTHYTCDNGHISTATVACAPPPGPNCVPVPVSGQCCPRYNCDNSLCVDNTGQVRPHGSTWNSADGCTHYACDNGHISTATVDCAPSPGPNCVPEAVPGQCCPSYNCSDSSLAPCTHAGRTYPDGAQFPDDEDRPCSVLECDDGTVRVVLPPPQCATLTCVDPQRAPGQCCPVCPSDCVDNTGQVRPHGSTWTSADGCTRYACYNGHIAIAIVDCLLSPGANCVPVSVPGQCCPHYNCDNSHCVDGTGQDRPHGSIWTSADGCTHYACDNGHISTTIVACAPPPGPNCVPVPVPGQCCPRYNCDNSPCVDGTGQVRPHGSTWTSADGCTHYACDNGHISIAIVDCAPPPGPNCVPVTAPEQCCPRYNCDNSHCVDGTGQVRPHGSTWTSADGCAHYTCDNGHISTATVDCAPPPRPNCVPVPVSGQCCPSYNCSDSSLAPCTHAGRTYPDGAQFPDDEDHPCSVLECDDGTVRVVLPPPQCATLTCVDPQQAPGQCCPVCPADCKDNTGQVRPHGSTWTSADGCTRYACYNGHISTAIVDCLPSPGPNCVPVSVPGDCCPDYNCDNSHCADSTGQVRPHGSTWTSADGCTHYTCDNGHVSTAAVDCTPPPGPTCVPVPLPGQCCPRYNCDSSPCVDGTGRVRPHGSTWTSADGCTHYACDNGHISTAIVDCTPPPGPYCVPVPVPGQCCPRHDCDNSDCVDGTGQDRPHGSTWTSADVCTHYACDNGHISTAIVDCAPPPRPNCVPVPVSGQCCPSYNCSDSSLAPCTHAGRTYPDGAQFPDDEDHPCSVLECDDGTVRVVLPPPQCATLTCVDPQQAPGQCCPVCPADCVDNAGQVRPHGSTWTSADGCTRHACYNGHISNATVDCLPSPGPNCVPVPVPGECCPHYNCDNSQCVDGAGQVRPHGSTWTSADGCTHYTCDNGHISTTTVDCAPPPGPNCVPVLVAGQCCPNYNCHNSPCVDGTGQDRPHGSTWNSADGCTHYACDNGHISTAIVDCAPPPRPNCVPVPVPGQCCPSYNCSDSTLAPCTHAGRTYPDGAQFPDNEDHPCSVLECDDGTVRVVLPPPQCATLTCVDPQQAPGQCCPVCPAEGCVDSAGVTHAVNSVYLDGLDTPGDCYVCAAGSPPQPLLVQNVARSCPRAPPGCNETFEEGRCCPTISCPDGDPCIFEGVAHAPGTQWMDDLARPCVTYTCVLGVAVQVGRVECAPLPDGCSALYTDGFCCPEHYCPGAPCTHAGQQHDDGTSWPQDPVRPCTILSCHDGHVLSEDVSDQCAPPPTGPGTCTPAHVDYQCCPVHDCVQATCEYNGTTYSEGDTWPDNETFPCKRFNCTLNGPIKVADYGAHCPPQPNPHCTGLRAPGYCCKQWNCPDGPKKVPEEPHIDCVDGTGQVRPHGSTWTSADGCTHYACDHGHISNSTVDCAPPPRPNCVPVPVPGQCCPSYNCSDSSLAPCTHAGRTYPDGAQFPDDEDRPCSVLECDDGTVRVVLPPPQCATLTCVNPQQAPGQCCPVCPAEGCVDSAGVTHAVNSVYLDGLDTPGDCYVCAAGSPPQPLLVQNVARSCPRAPPGCNETFEEGRCCPTISCPDGDPCIFEGVAHAPGTQWMDDLVRPCVTYTCVLGVAVQVGRVECTPLPDGCSALYTDGFCCPEHDCPGAPCTHAGQQHDDGTSWPQDPVRPCTILSCHDGHVLSKDVSDQCAPPPTGPGTCTPAHVDYQCCPVYDCVQATCEYDGTTYSEGDTWPDNETFPCKRFNCTLNGPVKVADYGAHCPPQPNPHCTGLRTPGYCCKQWNCPDGPKKVPEEPHIDCVVNGTVYSNDQTWWAEPHRRCLLYACRHGAMVLLKSLLPCPAVPANCTPLYQGTDCCHYKYTCTSCMFDTLGNLLRRARRR
ncbi:zonadhesin-like [Pollicipes pollicipes]|uniref:zonadhesin-like n=1 Tax=Pollicipes pollicipes TaxID=41117 RepID=UPI00188594CC|nr:zonadhesin-like [Pollicipes pollicipes]